MKDGEFNESDTINNLDIGIKNCYGITSLRIDKIQFDKNNVALIYASNGVMKTSLAKVFEDLRIGNKSEDRIFKKESKFTIKYRNIEYENGDKFDRIFVFGGINSVFPDSTSKILGNFVLRSEYNDIMSKSSDIIKGLEKKLSDLSGLKEKQITTTICNDFKLKLSEWPNIISDINKFYQNYVDSDIFDNVEYTIIFNDKTNKFLNDDEFKSNILSYEEKSSEFFNNSSFFSLKFDDYAASELSKAMKNNNLFDADHKIILKNGEKITNLNQWTETIKKQKEDFYDSPDLKPIYESIYKLLNANVETKKLKSLLIGKKELISYFHDLDELKKKLWLHYFNNLDFDFSYYLNKLNEYAFEIDRIFEKASEQSDRWKNVINLFNDRFRVPFKIVVENQSNILLKDERPVIHFEYYNSHEDRENIEDGVLQNYLSTGEKRALNLLYAIFEIENIRDLVSDGSKYLIVADDIADSFDYRNKYSIVEYLRDISEDKNINMLIMTHNFDFYRTVERTLNIEDGMIVSKKQHDDLKCSVLKNTKNKFENEIKNNLNSDSSKPLFKKCIVASIPFYRNILSYVDKSAYNKVTTYLHITHDKKSAIDNINFKLKNYVDILNDKFKLNIEYKGNDNLIEIIIKSADTIKNNHDDESLVDKLVMSIAIRLKAECFLKEILIKNDIDLSTNINQTFVWFKRSIKCIKPEEKMMLDEVNIVTPEYIHLNSFMYEPLIDMSIYNLLDLYEKISSLIKKYDFKVKY